MSFLITNRRLELGTFLNQELNNGYVDPLGISVIEVTKGPLTNKKQKQLNTACEKLYQLIENIKFKGTFSGIEKILIGFRIPSRDFKPRQIVAMGGDQNFFCQAAYYSGAEVGSNNKRYLEICFAEVIEKELKNLGGGATWTGYLYKNSDRKKGPIAEFDVVAVGNAQNLTNILYVLEKYGVTPLT